MSNSEATRRERLRRALLPAVLVEAAIMIAGVVAYVMTNELKWLLAAVLVSAIYVIFALFQAGVFDNRGEGK